MTAQALTVVSGVVLLLVFVIVGWTLRRRGGWHERDGRRSHDEKP